MKEECKPVGKNLPACKLAKPTGKAKELQDDLNLIAKEINRISIAFSKKYKPYRLHISTGDYPLMGIKGGDKRIYRISADFNLTTP